MTLSSAAFAVEPRVGARMLYARPLGVNTTLPVVAQIHCFSMPCSSAGQRPRSLVSAGWTRDRWSSRPADPCRRSRRCERAG